MQNKIFKTIYIIMILITGSNAWEVNTHRAIDRTAIKLSGNLYNFLEDAGINPDYRFEDKYLEYYDTTYFDYITFTEEKNGVVYNGSMSEIGLDFLNHNYQDLMEAGSILEDATIWNMGLFGANGRFLNHFYNAQDDGDGYAAFGNALEWAKGNAGANTYSLNWAYNDFFWAFTRGNRDDRESAKAAMFVAVGHLMHLFNDMNVPAHVRGDGHNPDPFEYWTRGGANHKQVYGYKIVGNTKKDSISVGNPAPNKFSDFSTPFIAEATRTSLEFFSKDTIFYKPTFDYMYSPTKNDVTIPELDPDHPSDYDYVTDNATGMKMAVVYHGHWFSKNRIAIDTSVASDPIHEDYGKKLIPRAIANAAGFVNYFFRGSMDLKMKARTKDAPCQIIVKNDSDKNKR